MSYVAHLRDFVSSPSFFGSYHWMGGVRNVPPLLDWLLYLPALLVDPAHLFKIYPPVAYGCLTALVATYCVKVLNRGGRTVFAVSLAFSLSLIGLRLSWDLHKQMLSQILIIASLILVDSSERDPRSLLKAVPLLLLAGLASEFGAAISIIISAYTLLLHVRWLRGLDRALISAVYSATAVVSYALISWYLRAPIAGNLVLGYTPPVVTESLTFREWVYPYILICLGPLIPFFLLGIERFWGRAKVSIATASTLVALSLSPLLTPLTDFSGGEWDRLLMSASPFIVALAVPQLSLMRSRVAKIIFLVFLTLPGFLAVSTEGLNNLNSVLVSSLWRMPAGIVPTPGILEIYDQALEVAEEISRLGKPVVTGPWVERFVHLYLRNPRPGDIIVVPRTTPEDVACALLLNNLSRAYVITINKWGEVIEVVTSDSSCLEDLAVGSETRVEVVVKEVSSRSFFKILEVVITRNSTSISGE